MEKEIADFLDRLIAKITEIGIDTDDLKIDHVAYSVSSGEKYDELLPSFLDKGKLVREAIVGGRRVAIVKLIKPLEYRSQNVDAVELIEPKQGETKENGWEHAEFLVVDYDEILAKYPDLDWNLASKDRKEFSRIKLSLPGGLEVKFLMTPVLDEV